MNSLSAEPPMIGELLLPTVERNIAAALANPRAEKEGWKSKIVAACGRLHPVTDWVAGAAANLVVYQDVDGREINRILLDLQAMREVGTLQNAGAFFHSQARKLAIELGKPWPRHAIAQKATADQ